MTCEGGLAPAPAGPADSSGRAWGRSHWDTPGGRWSSYTVHSRLALCYGTLAMWWSSRHHASTETGAQPQLTQSSLQPPGQPAQSSLATHQHQPLQPPLSSYDELRPASDTDGPPHMTEIPHSHNAIDGQQDPLCLSPGTATGKLSIKADRVTTYYKAHIGCYNSSSHLEWPTLVTLVQPGYRYDIIDNGLQRAPLPTLSSMQSTDYFSELPRQ